MATALTRPESGFIVGVACPGCGGEIELSRDFFVTTCGHCGSVLRVLMPQATPAFIARPKITPPQARAALDRYLRDSGRPLTTSNVTCRRILYPYWRIEAYAAKVRTVCEEVPAISDDHSFEEREPESHERRTVGLSPYSTSIAAGPQYDLIPSTIGIRAEYLKLHPMESCDLPEGYECIPASRDWVSALAQAESSVRKAGAIEMTTFGQNRTDLVYPRASLLFFPFIFVESSAGQPMRAIVDAVAGRVELYSPVVSKESDLQASPQHSATFGTIGLEFHRCKNCGQDLPAQPSLVYLCPNCGKLTALGSITRENIRCTGHSPSDLLVPFWVVPLSTVAETVLVPAFRIANAEAMYRLSRRISGAASRLTGSSELTGNDHIAPATIDRAEAQAIADVISFRRAIEQDVRARFAPTATSTTADLLFVPFRPEEYFYRDTVTGAVTFESALLKRSV